METNYETRIINHALKSCGYYPLRAVQLWLVDTHFNKANSTMMNIGFFLKLPPEIDLEKLAQALNETLNAYDIFRCRLVFHPETSDICQRFDGEIIPVRVEKISDMEIEQRKEILKKPYALINKPLYRFYIFETPTAKYMYGDFYHAIMDGTSAGILFWREIEMRYQGKNIKRQPLRYADFILDELRISPEELADGNRFWRETTAGFDATKHLPPADVTNAQEWTSSDLTVPIKNISRQYFLNNVRKEMYYFLGASMLAIAKSTGAKNSVMSLVHNGRNTAQERRLMGIMLEQIPISLNFETGLTVEKFLDELEIKFNTGMKYRRSLGTIYNAGMQDDCATFIFQKKFHSLALAGYELETVELPQNEWSAAENSLDIEINLLEDGSYYLFLDYDAGRYSESAMEKFAAIFEEMVLKLQDERKLISEILS